MIRRETVRSRDGTPIAYSVRGLDRDDAPAVVFTSGYTASDFYWRGVFPRLESRAKVVAWDFKGHGRSGPVQDPSAVTIPDSVDDLRLVLDAEGIERAYLVAFSLGCQVIFEAWRHVPERIAGLIPVLGTYQRPFDHLLHPAVGPRLFQVFRRVGPRLAGPMLKAGWAQSRIPGTFKVAQGLGLIGPRVRQDDMRAFFAHMRAIHGPTWAELGIAAQSHSAGDLLERIAVPVLVVAGGRDTFMPFHLSLDMCSRLPDAELLYFPDATHTGLFEYPAEIAARLALFLEQRGWIAPVRRYAAASSR